MNKFS